MACCKKRNRWRLLHLPKGCSEHPTPIPRVSHFPTLCGVSYGLQKGVRQTPIALTWHVTALCKAMLIGLVGIWSPISTYPFKRIRKTPDLAYLVSCSFRTFPHALCPSSPFQQSIIYWLWGKLFCFSRLWQKIAPYLMGWLFLGFHMFSKLHSRTDTFQRLLKGSFKKNHVTKKLYPKKPLHLVGCVPISIFFSRKGEIGTLFPVVNLEYIETDYKKYLH